MSRASNTGSQTLHRNSILVSGQGGEVEMPLSHTIYVRFFGKLRDFLDVSRRNRRFAYTIKGCPSVKDTLEAIGVPHVAIDAIFVNKVPCDFSRQLMEADEIRVYPKGHLLKKRAILHLQTKPPAFRFVVDSHLGKLVRHLRLLGFDSHYKTVFPDKEIAQLAVRERRIVLTRDKGLLKYKCLKWAYWVRSPDPEKQLREVVKHFGLQKHIRSFTLCVECNGEIRPVDKAKVLAKLLPKTRIFFKRFYRCRKCHRIYWKGSHYARLSRFIRKLKKKA
jgi:uncharacterized protein with PIN domain